MWDIDKQKRSMPQIYNLNDVLKDAAARGYAVGSFSPRYTKIIAPVILAAMAVNSPVIVQLSEKEIKRHQVSLKAFAEEFYRQVALLQPSVPIVLHLDHTISFDIIKEAIENKFTSVMIDASEYGFDENVAITKKVTDYAHRFGVSVEGELGRIGTTDFIETDRDEELHTDAEEARQFCELTKVDALAVSVGTAHGMYTTKQPRIDFSRLEAINRLTDTPLVLHGASGVPDDMLIKAVSIKGGGVSKVNIATDIEQAVLKVIGEKTHITEEQLNNYDQATLAKAEAAVQSIVEDKIVNYLLSKNKA